MIPSPNLDDRTYKEIVDEAIRLIPHYCSEWTNHNPSDPGITLIELFAWMTEMMIYRFNKVPEKTYLALLDLLGLSLSPPQSSKVLLKYYPVEGYKGTVLLKRGMQVSTESQSDHEAVVFETDKNLQISNISMDACFGVADGKIINNIDVLENEKNGFALFNSKHEIERHIYIASPMFEYLTDQNIISISFSKSINQNKIFFIYILLYSYFFK